MRAGLRADRLPNREPIWIAVDGLLAFALAVVVLDKVRSDGYVDAYGPVDGVGLLLVIGPSALILVRRAAPATVLATATVMTLLAGFDHGESDALNAGPFLAYMVAISRPPRRAAIIVAASALAVSAVGFYGPGPREPSVPVIAAVVYGVAWAAGARLRAGRDRTAHLAEEAERARREAADAARQAVIDERIRIARELHDAVGHAVNVMVLQAGAGRLVRAQPAAVDAFRNVERVGRAALTDLDRMLGLLHADGAPAPRSPAYGLADIGDLVEQLRATGASIELHDEVSGDPELVRDRPVGAAAYRIVQEALTNAVKHAGSARIVVEIRCEQDDLIVTVNDDGRGAAAATSEPTGRGLAGMHERVSVLGGTLRVGPRAGGGYGVAARLPRGAGS